MQAWTGYIGSNDLHDFIGHGIGHGIGQWEEGTRAACSRYFVAKHLSGMHSAGRVVVGLSSLSQARSTYPDDEPESADGTVPASRSCVH